jgi:hypothetical protein
MNRNSLTETAGRAMHMIGRFTLNAGNPDPMMQELAMDLMNSDGRSAVEHVQSFGFSATPLPRSEGDASKASDSALEGFKGAAAEGICVFVGGQRNHPVCIGVDDRRYRPMGLKPGESGQYDDIGQMTLLRRGGTFMLSCDGPGGDGKSQERMVSLRHVEKPRQQRPSDKPQQASGNGAGAQALASPPPPPNPQDYKHEGETVNTEVRCTKGRIEFRAGDKVVGYYDVAADAWYFTAKIITNEATAQIKDKAPRIDHN